MAKLKVDINTMNSAANTLEKVSEELQEIIEEYKNICDELSNTWDGAASEEFIRRLRTQITNLGTVQLTVVSMEGYSKSVAATMKAIDVILTEMLKGFMIV